MDLSDARAAVVTALGSIAPEVDLGAVDSGAALAEEADLDSMDMLRLLESIAGTTGVEVPEADVAGISLDGLLARLVELSAG